MDRRNQENIIGVDFQGWPVYKLTLKQILMDLGAKEYESKDGNIVIGFDNNDESLNLIPRVLEDDGMGYGVNLKYITEGDKINNEYVNIFVKAPNKENANNKSAWKNENNSLMTNKEFIDKLQHFPENANISIEYCNPREMTYDIKNNLIKID